MLRALRNTGIIVIYQSPDLRVLWTQNVPDSWADGDIRGARDIDFLPAGAGERIAELKRAVLETGVPERYEFKTGSGSGDLWFDMWIDADQREDGPVAGIVSTIVDITEQKHREQTLRTLLREVSHRSKNLLAIILSIATQTGRYTSNIDTFLSRFRGRVQSLASSQDLVTSSNWRGAPLHELVEGQVSKYCNDVDGSVRFSGVDPYLNPNAALHIGLALHELLVNSISHGALADDAGSAALTATLDGVDGERTLYLTWSEAIPPDLPIDEKRFGSVALERVVPVSIDGEAELTFADGHLTYRLKVPRGSYELDWNDYPQKEAGP